MMKKLLMNVFCVAIVAFSSVEATPGVDNLSASLGGADTLKPQIEQIEELVKAGKAAGLTEQEVLQVVQQHIENQALADGEVLSSTTKKIILGIIVLAIVGGGIYWLWGDKIKKFFSGKTEDDELIDEDFEKDPVKTKKDKKAKNKHHKKNDKKKKVEEKNENPESQKNDLDDVKESGGNKEKITIEDLNKALDAVNEKKENPGAKIDEEANAKEYSDLFFDKAKDPKQAEDPVVTLPEDVVVPEKKDLDKKRIEKASESVFLLPQNPPITKKEKKPKKELTPEERLKRERRKKVENAAVKLQKMKEEEDKKVGEKPVEEKKVEESKK